MKRLADIVKSFSEKRVVVVGDAIADQFVHGQISRVSREAPVFILSHEHTETTPGGAGNCAANLAALGAKVALISVVGDDQPGQILIESLKTVGVDCKGVVVTRGRETTTKMRILAGQIHSPRQQVIRIDYEGDNKISADEATGLDDHIRAQAAAADAVIISDYNYGVADPARAVIAGKAAEDRSIPAVVDSRFRLHEFAGFTSATPNETEIEHFAGPIANESQLQSVGSKLREQLQYRALLVTRGSDGMMLFEQDKDPLAIAAVGSRQPVDVTGAGDTVIAAYTLALACEASFADAARIANIAGGIVVMKRGTATASASELLAAISQANA